MVGNLDSIALKTSPIGTPPVLRRQAVRTCHICLPDMDRPVGAIAYNNKLYSYVRFYPTLEAARRGCERLMQRGNSVLLTQAPKGLVLWVFEPDAQLVS